MTQSMQRSRPLRSRLFPRRLGLPTGLRAGIVIGVALALVGVAVGTATGVQQSFLQVLVVNPSSSPVPVAGTVTIGNSTSSPVPIVDVTPTPEPVAFSCQVSLASGVGSAAHGCYDVPSDKRLVIQQLSVYGSAPIGQAVLEALAYDGDSQLEVVMHDEGSNGFLEISVGSQFGVAYAAAGTALDVLALRSASTGSASVLFSFNGYLVPSAS
jgi:hypothetical protein